MNTKLNDVIMSVICHLQCHAGHNGLKPVPRTELTQYDADRLATRLIEAFGIDAQGTTDLRIRKYGDELTDETIEKVRQETAERKRQFDLDSEFDVQAVQAIERMDRSYSDNEIAEASYEDRMHREMVQSLESDEIQDEERNYDQTNPHYDDLLLSESGRSVVRGNGL